MRSDSGQSFKTDCWKSRTMGRPSTDKMTTTTHLLPLLMEKKPEVFSNGDCPVQKWKECWKMVMYQLPIVYKRGELGLTYHWGTGQMMAFTERELVDQIRVFEEAGFTKGDDDEVNAKGIYCVIDHPKKKKMGLKCEFTFVRYLKDGNRLCPLLWGVGCMADGFTYMKVKFSEVELTKDMKKMSLDLVNGKFSVE